MKQFKRIFAAFKHHANSLFSNFLSPSPSSGSLPLNEEQADERDERRYVPPRVLNVPTADVSLRMRTLIGNPCLPFFNTHPKTSEEWKCLISAVSNEWLAEIPQLQAKFNVTVTPDVINGIGVFIVTPSTYSEKNKERVLVHVHGGGYVFGQGLSGVGEAILMAGIGGYKIISIDYRMPPDFPYPAALDDAMAVWKGLVAMYDPKKMAIFGSSTGGGLTLAMVLRAKQDKLPLPAAIAPCTPWADLTETGDSYKTNEWIDNILVTWSGWLGDAANLYANGRSLKDPCLSPIYGDLSGFPPALLISGTRDLFLSSTVRTHRKLLRSGNEAELHVFEGQSHGQFMEDPDAPETEEAFVAIGNFFDRHLAGSTVSQSADDLAGRL